MKPTRIVSAHALLALLLSLFASACSNSHSPQAGDTATSWLRWCVDDADCAAPGRCLAHLCTLPCTPAGDPCAELAAEARCLAPDDSTPATCDMLCERDQDCAGLGSSYACAEGRCRSIGAVQLSAQTLSLQAEQDQENWG
ncbi:MAG TPA: hypothetical protein VFZ61_13885, partial [Polyangiales bacterium]